MYSANITGGGLLLQESRILARKLLSGVGLEELKKITREENLLQKRSPKSTAKMAGLIFSRLSLISKEFLPILAEGDRREASLLLLAAIAEAHTLVGDFLLYVSRECIARYQKNLMVKDWEKFWEQSIQIQPSLEGWIERLLERFLVGHKFSIPERTRIWIGKLRKALKAGEEQA